MALDLARPFLWMPRRTASATLPIATGRRPAGPQVIRNQGQPKARPRPPRFWRHDRIGQSPRPPLPGQYLPGLPLPGQRGHLQLSDLPTPESWRFSSDWGQRLPGPADGQEDVMPTLRQHVVARGLAMMERWGQPYPRPAQPPPLGPADLRALAERHRGTARGGSWQYLADMASEMQGQPIVVSDSSQSDYLEDFRQEHEVAEDWPTLASPPPIMEASAEPHGQTRHVDSFPQGTIGQPPSTRPAASSTWPASSSSASESDDMPIPLASGF